MPERPNWEAVSQMAMGMALTNRYTEASLLWREAKGLAVRLPPGDPRQAASLNNLAAAQALDGEWSEAERSFELALQSWCAARQWMLSAVVGDGARSSLFHFRLEQKHQAALDDHVRRRYAEYADVGRAVSAFGNGMLHRLAGSADAGSRRMEEALGEVNSCLGATHPLFRHMQRIAGVPDADWPLGKSGLAAAPDYLRDLRQQGGRASATQLMCEAVALAAVLDLKPHPQAEPAGPLEPAGQHPLDR